MILCRVDDDTVQIKNKCIVAHCIQCNFSTRVFCVENPAEDFISIEEVMRYTGVTKRVVNESPNKRKRDDDNGELTIDARRPVLCQRTQALMHLLIMTVYIAFVRSEIVVSTA